MKLVINRTDGNVVVLQSKLDGLFLDFDGTLFDTFPIHWQASNLALTEIGASERVSWEQYCAVCVRSNQKLVNILSSVSPEAFYAAKTKHLRDLARTQLRARPGVKALLEAIKLAGIPIAIVTTARRDSVMSLKSVWDLPDIDVIVSFEDTAKTKPEPDPYLLACKMLGVEPQYSIAIEDSPLGVIAAISAGLPCVVLRTSHFPADILPYGISYIASFEELSLEPYEFSI